MKNNKSEKDETTTKTIQYVKPAVIATSTTSGSVRATNEKRPPIHRTTLFTAVYGG
ncbi:MAG: hypothetical protein P4L61_01710 [Candidatus Pacebacteria bacterium]|nr:hypothetical protein [Candidatus Paceibacterota bacterium]